jgi:hypothetical protein
VKRSCPPPIALHAITGRTHSHCLLVKYRPALSHSSPTPPHPRSPLSLFPTIHLSLPLRAFWFSLPPSLSLSLSLSPSPSPSPSTPPSPTTSLSKAANNAFSLKSHTPARLFLSKATRLPGVLGEGLAGQPVQLGPPPELDDPARRLQHPVPARPAHATAIKCACTQNLDQAEGACTQLLEKAERWRGGGQIRGGYVNAGCTLAPGTGILYFYTRRSRAAVMQQYRHAHVHTPTRIIVESILRARSHTHRRKRTTQKLCRTNKGKSENSERWNEGEGAREKDGASERASERVRE